MKNIPFRKFWPGIIWFFVVLIIICIPGSGLPKMDNWISRIPFDKWIHVGIFGVLAFLWVYPILQSNIDKTQKWKKSILIAVAISLWGLTAEFIQKYYIPGREFEWLDWAADSVGVLIALIIVVKKGNS